METEPITNLMEHPLVGSLWCRVDKKEFFIVTAVQLCRHKKWDRVVVHPVGSLACFVKRACPQGCHDSGIPMKNWNYILGGVIRWVSDPG